MNEESKQNGRTPTGSTGGRVLKAGAAVLACAAPLAAGAALLLKKKRPHGKKRAMIDPLTGIGNAEYYSYVFRTFITQHVWGLYYVAYISLNESAMKNMITVREEEEVQRLAARKLQAMAAPGECVFRVEEGVFVYLYQSTGSAAAQKRMEDLLGALGTYLGSMQSEYEELFAAGICSLADNRGITAEQALNIARPAYSYAADHRKVCTMATLELLLKNQDEERLRLSIGKAIENGEFSMYLQFIVDKSTERICGAEVLSRWTNHEFGLILPGRYISIMRRTGAVKKHDYAIFEQLCALLECWNGTRYGELFLDCNFTRLSVSERNFADRIREIASKYSFDHSRLVIEITEDSLYGDSKLAQENISRCKAMGFKIAIDDMGSGFSVIADLYVNEIDLVKIDRSLVIEGVTPKGRRLLDSVIDMAHNMNAAALCEGVETDDQREMALTTSCDYIQGFAYSHVMPLDEAIAFFDARQDG